MSDINFIAHTNFWSLALTINATILASGYTFIVVVLYKTFITLTIKRANTVPILAPSRTPRNTYISVRFMLDIPILTCTDIRGCTVTVYTSVMAEWNTLVGFVFV
jgi:hypothetical protein